MWNRTWTSVAERLDSWRDEIGATKLAGLALTLVVATIVLLWGRDHSHRDGGPELVPVRGVVTLDGKPVSGGTITFIPDGTVGTVGPMSSGLLREGGCYELLAPRGRRGAVPGRHQVVISARTIGSDERPAAWTSVPTWYAQPQTSGLTGEVRATRHGPLAIDFALTSGSSWSGSQTAASVASGADRR